MVSTLVFIGGFLAGLLVGLVLLFVNTRQSRRALEAQQLALRETFASLSADALRQSSEQFLQLAGEKLNQHTASGTQQLDSKKQLIDESIKGLKTDLQKVENLMTSLEKDRHQKFGELTQELKRAATETEKLQQTTNQLHTALANTKTRGQWGERMAEDVLRLAGFVEGINYQKQRTLNDDGARTRPDYTFMLPAGQVVNMDVKFPLDNYLLYLNAESAIEKEQYRKQFLSDARDRIKEASKRGYIDTTSHTLDYVLIFIPNEQVFAFIHEHDSALVDDAMRNKVILCSPMTLYAVLAVIRQAVDNFQLERKANEMLELLGKFHKQWGLFSEQMEKVEKKFSETQNAFSHLLTTRRNQLEKPLNKIEELRQQQHGTELPLLQEADTSDEA